MNNGDQIQWPANALTIKAKEGGKVEKTFTYDLPWENAQIEAPEIQIQENSQSLRSLVKGENNQQSICTIVNNQGSQNLENLQIKYDFPT